MTAPTQVASAATAQYLRASARFSSRFFDERLDEGFDLVAVERFAVGSRARLRGRTRRGGNGHASQRFTNKLVLLVH